MTGLQSQTARCLLLAGVSLMSLGAPALALAQTAPPTPAPAATAPAKDLETIVVSARKRDESIIEVPVAITAFTAENLQDYNIQSFTDYATKTPNMSFSYGGGPTGISEARTVAIRGITGQNLTGTAGATGFYIDDTPVPGSVDPRVLDIDNIEVLKGPQGTLFGESSLGGNVRLITKKPDFTKDDFGYSVDSGVTAHGGSPDGGASAIGNVVLVPDKLALRAVAFGDHEAGYHRPQFTRDAQYDDVRDERFRAEAVTADENLERQRAAGEECGKAHHRQ